MRIFIGLNNIASSLQDWAYGFRMNGCSVTLGYTSQGSSLIEHADGIFINNTFNENFKNLSLNKINKIYNFILKKRYKTKKNYWIKKLIKENDIFFFMWSTFFDNNEDLEIIKNEGKKIIVQFVGDDIRWVPAMKQHFGLYNSTPMEYKDYDYSPDHLSKKLQFLRKAEKFADLIYSVPSQSQLAIKRYGCIPLLLQANKYEGGKEQRQEPHIIHYPSSSLFKGSKYFNDAINEITNISKFMYSTSPGETNYGSDKNVIPAEKIKKIYQDCDILLGQILCPGGGKQERELLACGKVVLSNMNKKIEPHIPDDCPIVDVNIHTIKDILLQIIPDKKLRQMIADKGRAFVEKHHNPITISAQVLREINSGIYEQKAYTPSFFLNKYIPESDNHANICYQWTDYIKKESWFPGVNSF